MYLNAAPGGQGAGPGETKHMPSFIQVTAKVNHMVEGLPQVKPDTNESLQDRDLSFSATKGPPQLPKP